jgi:hypothetical protein
MATVYEGGNHVEAIDSAAAETEYAGMDVRTEELDDPCVVEYGVVRELANS